MEEKIIELLNKINENLIQISGNNVYDIGDLDSGNADIIRRLDSLVSSLSVIETKIKSISDDVESIKRKM